MKPVKLNRVSEIPGEDQVQGVGSCWMGAFDEPRLKETLNLPADSRLVGAIAFGIPDEKPLQPQKRSLNEIVHFDKW